MTEVKHATTLAEKLAITYLIEQERALAEQKAALVAEIEKRLKLPAGTLANGGYELSPEGARKLPTATKT